jgi:hypothetical protein
VCFSVEADLVAGVVITAVGVDALRQVHDPSERAIAALPVCLGAHLLVEAFVWWSLDGAVGAAVGRMATQIYLAFALCVLPLLVPLAVRAVEPDLRRRRLMAALAAIGVGLATLYLVRLLRAPVDVRIQGHHLAYELGLAHGGLVAGIYALVTCGAPLCASRRHLVAFGVANTVAVAALTWLQSSALTSLWCAWAAVASLAIAAHLRHEHRHADVRMTIV